MKIAIIADSSSGLEYAPFTTKIRITPTSIHFGQETLVDGRDIKADDFYLKLESSNIIPTTSCPSFGEFIEIITALKKEGYTDFIHFPISAQLSNYSLNLKSVIDSYELGVNFMIFDSKLAALMQGIVARYAEVLVEKGYSPEKIFSECTKLSKQCRPYFIVDDLKYLVQNGRLKRFAGTVATMARIKPILVLNSDGIIVPFEKVHTHKKAVLRVKELLTNEAQKYQKKIMLVVHTNRLADAKDLESNLQESIHSLDMTVVTTITPTVGAHIGSKVLGGACIGLDGLELDLIPYLKKY